MKKRKLSKKLLSYILCLVMVISLVPMNALTVRAEGVPQCKHCGGTGKVCRLHNTQAHDDEGFANESECHSPCDFTEEGCVHDNGDLYECEYCKGTGSDPNWTHDHHFVYVHYSHRSGDFHLSECDYPDCREHGDLPGNGQNCDTDGPDGACSYCGFKAEAPAHTHTKGTYHEPVAATCTNPGVVEYWDCSCGEKLDADGNVLASTEVAATGNHNFSVSVNETTHKCADCDATGNHKFSNSVVCDCGYELLHYEEFYGTKNVRITGCDSQIANLEGDLIIPETVSIDEEEYLVTEIGSAFNDISFKGGLVIPDSVTRINEQAFHNCSFKGDLVIPDSVTRINEQAFVACSFSGGLIIADGLTDIDQYAFTSCEFAGGLTIADSVILICEYAFYNCSFTGGLTLPKNLPSIFTGSFYNCGFTGDLIIPDMVSVIADEAFSGCDFGGVLKIGNGVKTIGHNAFAGCNFTGSLTIPNGVETIGRDAFWKCGFTGNVEIPNSVETIDEQPFLECANITSISIPCFMDYDTDFGISVEVTQRGHVFGTDEQCEVCGCLGTSDVEEIVYEVDINGTHHLKYDEDTEMYICQDEDCGDEFEPGYYCEVGDASYEYANYALMGNMTSAEELDFWENENLIIADFRNLISAQRIAFAINGRLKIADFRNLKSVDYVDMMECRRLETLDISSLSEADFCMITSLDAIKSIKIHEGNPANIGTTGYEGAVSYVPHTYIADKENIDKHKCSVCGIQRTHKFVNKECSLCKVKECVVTGNHDFSQNGTCACGLIQIEFEIINDDEKTVRVTGLNKDFDMTHDLFIPSTVEVNGEDYSVTEIGAQAFWECNITGEVVIPDSVITIGDYTFSGCGNIERISIPCTIDPYEIYWGIDSEKIVQRSHDFSNGALKCNLCGKCKALSETGRHDFNDEFKCTNCGQVDQFGVYFSQYKDLVIVENDDNKPWAWDMDKQSLVPDNVDSYAYSSMTITAKKRVKISFSYSFDNAPNGEDMLFIKKNMKEGDYEDYEEYEERYPSDYNGEYPYDDDNRDPLILYPGDTLQINYRFGSEYRDEGIRLGEFKINEITYVEIKGMSLELDPVYGAYIGVNLYIDASDNASLYFDDMPVTPDGEELKLVIDDNTGIKKIQYRCAVKEFADIHKLAACDGDGNTIDLSIDQYTDVEEFTYGGMSYCDAVLAGGTVYSDELEDVCNALIEFNEQARNYFEYNNDGLNVGSVTADIPTTGYEASMTGKLPEGCSYIGSSLVLEEQLVLRHYFVGNIGSEVISCVATTNNKAVEITTGNTADDRMTYVDIAAPYSQIADMYKVIIGDGETAYTLTYGVLTYCNKAYELGQNSELVNTCNAMYNYSVAVNAYFSIGQ